MWMEIKFNITDEWSHLKTQMILSTKEMILPKKPHKTSNSINQNLSIWSFLIRLTQVSIYRSNVVFWNKHHEKTCFQKGRMDVNQKMLLKFMQIYHEKCPTGDNFVPSRAPIVMSVLLLILFHCWALAQLQAVGSSKKQIRFVSFTYCPSICPYICRVVVHWSLTLQE